jgi:hypothetical protein
MSGKTPPSPPSRAAVGGPDLSELACWRFHDIIDRVRVDLGEQAARQLAKRGLAAVIAEQKNGLAQQRIDPDFTPEEIAHLARGGHVGFEQQKDGSYARYLLTKDDVRLPAATTAAKTPAAKTPAVPAKPQQGKQQPAANADLRLKADLRKLQMEKRKLKAEADKRRKR